MTPVHGSVAGLLVQGYDLSTYFNSLQSSDTIDENDTTAFPSLGQAKNAKDYRPGLDAATMQLQGFFDVDQSGTTHEGLDDVLSAAIGKNAGKRIVCALPFGDGFGKNADGMLADFNSYDISSSVSAMVTTQAAFQSSTGLDPLEVLHALAAETGVMNGADLDAGASYDATKWKGAVAYLHVTNIVGASPDVTVKVQHSLDGTTWVDLVTFAAVTAEYTAQRATFTGTVNRHLRAIVSAMTGTSITFHVAAGRTPK